LNEQRFRAYLNDRWAAFIEGAGNVPCGSCRGCCRAGYAIGLSKIEAAELPHHVIDGHAVILPMPDGACPFLVDEACSIYAKRPVSCRQFDCRDFAMAAVKITEQESARGLGVGEINASIERFRTEYGDVSSVVMAKIARDMIAKGSSAVAAGQNAMVMAMMNALPEDKTDLVVEALLGEEEDERGKAMKAYDRSIGVPVGKPS